MLNNKARLMRQIQTHSFAAHDASLYLDSHPDSKAALDYFKKNKMIEKRLTEEYERQYGPISIKPDIQSWEWVKGPWPWQNESGKGE